MKPRIYTYKITFEEVPYYYYGVHKERRYNEYYMGTPVTHKWCWELYTPKKQILEFFEYNDEGWRQAQEVEKRIIRPFYQMDKWCLNENCGGVFSMEVCRNSGKKLHEQGLGIHGRSKEKMSEDNRRAGKNLYEQGLGIHALTPEQRTENGKKSYRQKIEKGIKGVHSLTAEERREIGKKSYEERKGIHALTPEQRREIGKKSGEKNAKEFALISPEGEIVRGKNIRKFCRENNLDDSAIHCVLNGIHKQHKGWRKYIPEHITILDFL